MNWIKLVFIHIVMAMLFYYYLLSPIKLETASALKVEKDLEHDLWKNQQQSHVSNEHNNIKIITITSRELIHYFLNKIADNRFFIKEIYPTRIQKNGNLIRVSFKLVYTGDMFQLMKWIDQLHHDYLLINIDEITLNHAKKSSNKATIKIDVFNVHDEVNRPVHEAFQWIGYKNYHKALLRFENGDIQEVVAGSLIHKKIKILQISNDQMILQVDHRQFHLQYGQLLEI